MSSQNRKDSQPGLNILPALIATDKESRHTWSSERIRRLRRKLGLTQLQLANVLRMSKGAIVNWECGYAGPPIGPATVVLDLLERQVAVTELLATSGPKPKRGRPRKSQ